MPNQRIVRASIFFTLALTWQGAVVAGTLPATSRTVFKCVVNGQVTYSDDPCLGAEKLEIEPTRGLDQWSGKKKVGSDIQREYRREGVAEALRPLTGMTAKQLEKHQQRTQLPAPAQLECRELDAQIPTAEQAEQRASPADRATRKKQLYELRVRYRALRC